MAQEEAVKRGDEVGDSLKPESGNRDFEVSSRLYADASKDDFKSEVEEVKKDNPTAATIEYDAAGEVKSFTFDNKKLYDKDDADLPKKLATETIVDDIRRRDADAGQSDKVKVAKTFGFDGFDVQDRVLKQVATEESAKMGANLKDGKLAQVYEDIQGLKQLYANPKELQSVLERARAQSGLPEDSTAITNEDGKLSFKVNGQEMMGDTPPQTAPPSTGDRTADAPAADTPAADIPAEPPTDTPAEPPADLPPSAEREPEKLPPDEARESALEEQAKAQFDTKLGEFYENQNKSLPARAGEGYYQVLDRMHPDWSPQEKVKEARRLREFNGPELKVGQRFALHTPAETDAARAQSNDIYDKAPPEDRKAMLSDLTAQVAAQNAKERTVSKK